MKKEVMEEIIIGYNEFDRNVISEGGDVLYIEHIKEPIKEVKKSYVEQTLFEINQLKIYELKKELEKYKEDIEQVELFGMARDDYQMKKERCKEIILELRKLETQK